MWKSVQNLPLALLIAAVTLPVSAGTQVFITRDADGNPIFSDRKSSNSETHVVKELPSMPAFKTAPPKPEQADPEPALPQYTSLSIISPVDGTTVQRGQNGNLQVSGVLTPSLNKGDSIVLRSGSKELARSHQSTFNLTHLERGEHVLTMSVENANGESLIQSQNIKIFVQRASSLAR
ncbi:MAG: hypothetical protein VW258_09910 [Thalassolituus sp.]